MTDQEVKKLKRVELLEMLIEQSEENERLKAQIAQLEGQLAERRIAMEQAGSIAEASMSLSGVFRTAQDAADRYLESVRQQNAEAEAKSAAMLRDTEARCNAIRAEIRAKCEKLIADSRAACKEEERRTKERCDAMLADAKKQMQEWESQRAAAVPEPSPESIPKPESEPEETEKRSWWFGRK